MTKIITKVATKEATKLITKTCIRYTIRKYTRITKEQTGAKGTDSPRPHRQSTRPHTAQAASCGPHPAGLGEPLALTKKRPRPALRP
jgi:hypothetical protein